MSFYSTKTYGHERGMSCVYRQPQAKGHCSLLHGYALSFKFKFWAPQLDERGWVVDFGSLQQLEKNLREVFDHTLVVSRRDPYRAQLVLMADENRRLANVVQLPGVGCEAFAFFAHSVARECVEGREHDVRVVSCEVAEHGANSAIYINDDYRKDTV